MASVHAPEGLILFSPDFRVKLTLPTPEDDDAIIKLRSNPAVRAHMPFLPVVKKEAMGAQREIRAQDASILDFVVWIWDNEKRKGSEDNEQATYTFAGVTGVFGMNTEHLSCEAGIILAPEHQGKGLTTPIFYALFKYLFEKKGLHRISFKTSSGNSRMIRWLENVAEIRLEGEKRQAWKSGDGGWLDVRSYAVLKKEWEDRVKGLLQKKMGVRIHW